MTAVILHLAPNQVIVAADTLAMARDTRSPLLFTTKFYLLPHLGGAMFATGIGDLGLAWFARLQRFVATDIHHANEYVTPALHDLARQFSDCDGITTTVYHVGYSRSEDRYIGFAYRSVDSFRSERLGYGLSTKPGIENAELREYPMDLVTLMKRQKQADSALPFAQRVHIGGEVQALRLEAGCMFIETLHRFDDYESHYEAMCKNLGRFDMATDSSSDGG